MRKLGLNVRKKDVAAGIGFLIAALIVGAAIGIALAKLLLEMK